ncbi:MAG: sigma D regulator [Gammaproteobacteria bacterium]|nr:sigma D regulator [Gammaproteobacteria bacterium]
MSLTNTESPFVERRSRSRAIVDKMVAERQEMWVLYCKVAKLAPFSDEVPARDLLASFCQVLVDYIASAHFGLYERIVQGTERRKAVSDLATELYPHISHSTDVALAFNDRYESSRDFDLDESFSRDLSTLGEHLATRIELEDQLIDAMLYRG